MLTLARVISIISPVGSATGGAVMPTPSARSSVATPKHLLINIIAAAARTLVNRSGSATSLMMRVSVVPRTKKTTPSGTVIFARVPMSVPCPSMGLMRLIVARALGRMQNQKNVLRRSQTKKTLVCALRIALLGNSPRMGRAQRGSPVSR